MSKQTTKTYEASSNALKADRDSCEITLEAAGNAILKKHEPIFEDTRGIVASVRAAVSGAIPTVRNPLRGGHLNNPLRKDHEWYAIGNDTTKIGGTKFGAIGGRGPGEKGSDEHHEAHAIATAEAQAAQDKVSALKKYAEAEKKMFDAAREELERIEKKMNPFSRFRAWSGFRATDQDKEESKQRDSLRDTMSEASKAVNDISGGNIFGKNKLEKAQSVLGNANEKVSDLSKGLSKEQKELSKQGLKGFYGKIQDNLQEKLCSAELEMNKSVTNKDNLKTDRDRIQRKLNRFNRLNAGLKTAEQIPEADSNDLGGATGNTTNKGNNKVLLPNNSDDATEDAKSKDVKKWGIGAMALIALTCLLFLGPLAPIAGALLGASGLIIGATCCAVGAAFCIGKGISNAIDNSTSKTSRGQPSGQGAPVVQAVPVAKSELLREAATLQLSQKAQTVQAQAQAQDQATQACQSGVSESDKRLAEVAKDANMNETTLNGVVEDGQGRNRDLPNKTADGRDIWHI